jgi:hypothetical protein
MSIASRPPLNGLAIASLVLALMVVFAPLGLSFGIIALVQISRRGQRGRGLAIAGVVVSSVVLLIALAILTGVLRFSVWTVSGRPDTVGDNAPRRVFVSEIEKGDCFDPGAYQWKDGRGSLGDATAELVPCDEPHRAEAYGSFTLPDEGGFPGTEQITRAARLRCGELFFDYAMDPYMHDRRMQTFFYHPDSSGWARGGRTVLCWVAGPQADFEGSVRRDETVLDRDQVTYLSALKPLNAALRSAPQQRPEQDLAAATEWADRMATAQAESAQLLKEADLPAEASKPVAEFAAQLESGIPDWERTARAKDADTFFTYLRLAEKRAAGKEQIRVIRSALGLPSTPGSSA